MKIKITDPAKDQLKRIYRYYRRKGKGKKGRQVRKNVHCWSAFATLTKY